MWRLQNILQTSTYKPSTSDTVMNTQTSHIVSRPTSHGNYSNPRTVNILVSAVGIHCDAVMGIDPHLFLILITHWEVRDVFPAVDVIPGRLCNASQDSGLKRKFPFLCEVELASNRALHRHWILGWWQRGMWVMLWKKHLKTPMADLWIPLPLSLMGIMDWLCFPRMRSLFDVSPKDLQHSKRK